MLMMAITLPVIVFPSPDAITIDLGARLEVRDERLANARYSFSMPRQHSRVDAGDRCSVGALSKRLEGAIRTHSD